MSNAFNVFRFLKEKGYDSIREMVLNKKEENLFLDFKRKRNPLVNGVEIDDKKNYAKALSAFSNSSGGVVVWGVDARRDKNNRLILPVAPGSPFSIYNLLPSSGNIASSKYIVQGSTETNENNITEAIAPRKISASQLSPHQTMNSYPAKATPTMAYNFNSRLTVNSITMLIWLTGVIIIGVYVIFINWRLKLRIWTSSQGAQEFEEQVLERCKNCLNIRTDIPLMITSAVQAPVLFGFIRPSLLIPVDLLDKINTNELKHIFLHELSHFKRKDYAVNGLMVLLKIIHWFNPLV